MRFKSYDVDLWDGYLFIKGTSHLYVAAKVMACYRFTNVDLIMESHSSYIFISFIRQFCEML
jgi:uncharacterized membrane protein